jgi:uncharacterized RDD family membrane protein YckC
MSDPNLPNGAPPPDPNQPASAPPPPPPGAGYGAPPAGDPYQPAPGYGVPPAAANPFGGVGKRLLARIIDGLLVGIPLSILLSVLPGVRLGGLVSNAVIGIASFAYFVFMETSKGATFGKQWLGMSVADQNGSSPITTDASFRRNWWMLLGVVGGIPVIGLLASLASLVIVIVIAVTISSDARNQGFHDKMGKTLVLDRPPGAVGAQQ